MFTEVFSGFSKFFTPQRLFILVIFLTLAWMLLSYSDAKSFNLDGMETGHALDVSGSAPAAPSAASSMTTKSS